MRPALQSVYLLYMGTTLEVAQLEVYYNLLSIPSIPLSIVVKPRGQGLRMRTSSK